MIARIRGYALPDGEPIDLYADGDRWTTDPVPGATLVAEGWILPGLVDAHTHPGAEVLGDPLDEALLREDLRAHVAAGVTLIRSPGLAGDPPDWFGRDADGPRAVHAGPWIAQADQFFDNWGRRPAPEDLPAVAAEQAGRTGWAKLIGDWAPSEPGMPAALLSAVAEAVHAAGGRVAVHTNSATVSAAAVAAGIDSIEHGMGMDPELLHEMAARGIALTPTLSVINAGLATMRDRPPSHIRDWYLAGAAGHGALVAAAVEAGVTVLAGTDSRPHGAIATEVRAMVAAGVDPHHALGAASWVARDYLGLPGLVDGAPADAVIYDGDPRADLDRLATPTAVILRGTPSPSPRS